MPITPVSQLAEGFNTIKTSYTTVGSVTPVVDNLYLLTVVHAAAVSRAAPTVSGLGLTWVLVDTVELASFARTSVYRAMESSGLSAGTITVTWAGNVTSASVLLDRLSGTKTTGSHGADAIVQHPTKTAVGGTTITYTLSAFGNATANLGFISCAAAAPALSVELGWTILSSNRQAQNAKTAYKAGQDTSVVWTYTLNGSAQGIALEIAASPVTGAVGQAGESEFAQAMTGVQHGHIPVGMVVENEAAQSVSPYIVPGSNLRITRTLTASAAAGTVISPQQASVATLHLDPFTDPR